jgi:flagellar basal-body rod protein FlgC
MKVENVFGPIDIAVSGLRAQNKQMEVISSNISNARTTDAGKGEPYRRLEAVFKAEKDGISGVQVQRIAKDMSDFDRVLAPGNPKADQNGYVRMPNVSMPVEMMNLTLATRAYQANAAVLRRYQQMVETTLELLR